MKNNFIIIAVCISLSASSQDTVNNFHIENIKVIWERAYASQYKINTIYSAMKRSGDFVNIDTLDGQIIANLKPLVANYKGAGYKMINTAIIISQSDIDGFVLISFADNSIKVIVKKIIFIQRENNSLFKVGERTDLESLALNNKRKFKTSNIWNWGQVSKILDFTFNEKFEPLQK